MRAAIDRAVPARLLADPHAVRYLGRHGAANRAVRADALSDRHRGARGGPWAGLGLANAAQRKCPERGKAAGRKTRAAQEGAAIEAAIRFRGEDCATAAPLLAFRSPDKH